MATERSLGQAHVDRYQTHVASAIINVAQDADADWPVEILDHSGAAHRRSLKPGQVLPGLPSVTQRVCTILAVAATRRHCSMSLHGCCTPGRSRWSA